MRLYQAGTAVAAGYYINPRALELLTVGPEGGVLPLGPDGSFIRVPWAAILALAPVLGFAFVVFLPAIAFAMIAYYLAAVLWRLTTRGVTSVAAMALAAAGRNGVALAPSPKTGHTEMSGGSSDLTPAKGLPAEVERDIAA